MAVDYQCIMPAVATAAECFHTKVITTSPKVDGTDFYLFRSYEPGRAGYVTLIANYQPLQDSYGGPNYFSLDPNALYEIHVDNNGDAREDITFQFRFQNKFNAITLPVGGKNVAIPLTQAGTVSAPNAATLNVAAKASGFVLLAGQTLAGSGSVVGRMTVNGTVSPGASVGKMIFSSAPLLDGAVVMEISKNGATLTSDQLQVTAALMRFN